MKEVALIFHCSYFQNETVRQFNTEAETARKSFKKKIPTMRGEFKGDAVNEAVEKSRQNLINEAKKEPINMLVDSPDPHGELL